VALFGAEMRHVDGGGGIVGQQARDLARLQPRQALAQPKDGQGAEKAGGVDGEIRGHAGHLGGRGVDVHVIVGRRVGALRFVIALPKLSANVPGMDGQSSDITIEAGQGVRARRVLYIPGFDPVPARKYRERYRREAGEQARISGYEIALSRQQIEGPFGWHVEAETGGVTSRADIEVLIWADIVKDSMAHGIMATYWQLLRTAWVYIMSGALFRLFRLRKGPVIAALYPVLFLLGQLGIAVLAGIGMAVLVAWLGSVLIGVPLAVFGMVAGGGTIWAVLALFKRYDGKVLAYYLMHDYAFTARHGGANPPALEARLEDFKARVIAAMASDADEVLIVGHSSGAHLAVNVLADLLRQRRLPAQGPELAFLSLGQVVPMVSFLPNARKLRGDLEYLSQSEALTWVDVTAPGDGCAFALCDPVSVSGVAPEAGKRWPLVISAAFTQTLSPAKWKALRWRLFELHFQYLNAFDRPGDYDYFQITAGPETLAARFAGRTPSKSRIERAVNRFTDR